MGEEPGSGTPGSTSPSLLDRVKAGDEQSRDQLASLYLPLVYGRYLASVFNKEDRAELAQEVFLVVFQKINGFEKTFRGPAFRGWLREIARNKVRDYIKNQREAQLTDASEVPDPRPTDIESDDSEASDYADERTQLVRQALALVQCEFEPATYKAALQRLIEQRPASEVAEALNMSESAVHTARSRVLRRLRDILNELGEWDDRCGTERPSTGDRS